MASFQASDAQLGLRSELPAGWVEGYRDWLQRSHDLWQAELPDEDTVDLADLVMREKRLAGAEESLLEGPDGLRRASESASRALEFATKHGVPDELIERAKSEITAGQARTLETWLLGVSRESLAHSPEAAYRAALLALRRLDHEAAFEQFERAIELDPERLKYVDSAAEAAIYLERDDDAERLLLRALQLELATLGAASPSVGRRLNALAFLYIQHMRLEDARACLLQATRLQTRSLGSETYATLRNRALLCQLRGMRQEAAIALQRAEAVASQERNYRVLIDKWTRRHGENHPQVARTYALLAAYYRRQGRLDDAGENYARAVDLLAQGAASKRQLENVFEEWAQLKRDQGEPELADLATASAIRLPTSTDNRSWFTRLAEWVNG